MKHFPKIVLTLVVILALVTPVFAQAQVGTAINFTGCITGGILAPILQGVIDEWMNDVQNGLVSLISRLGLKIPGLNGIPFVGGTVPVHDETVEKTTGSLLAKEQRSDVIARCLGQEVLNGMIKSIVDNARTSGRDGGVAWVRNWRIFQLEAQYRGEEVFRGMLASSRLCNYFSDDIKGLFGANQRIPLSQTQTRTNDFDSFALRTGCTLPDNFDIDAYKRDFSGNGGWEAWSRLLEPQNNPYGALFLSLDEADKQRALEETADLNQALANDGFLGRSGDSASDSCSVRGLNGKCILYRDIKTPGGVIRASVDATVLQELERFNNVDELGELISSVTTVLLHRLLDLGNPNEGEYTVFGSGLPPADSAPPTTSCNVITVAEGAFARYSSETQSAMDQYLADNPSIANAPNTDSAAIDQFLRGVAEILNSQGFISGRAINCNGNLGSDAIMVSRPGDIWGDYFDLILSAGSGETIGNSAQVLFVEWAAIERLVP